MNRRLERPIPAPPDAWLQSDSSEGMGEKSPRGECLDVLKPPVLLISLPPFLRVPPHEMRRSGHLPDCNFGARAWKHSTCWLCFAKSSPCTRGTLIQKCWMNPMHHEEPLPVLVQLSCMRFNSSRLCCRSSHTSCGARASAEYGPGLQRAPPRTG